MAISRRINRLACQLKTGTETRSMDQLRADVFLDLLESNAPSSAGSDRGVVDIQIDLETLLGMSEQAGELAGYGPVISDIARQVAERQRHAEWRYTVTDSDTGLPLLVGTTGRRPNATQRRLVETRDRTCVFPGCRAPATQCDLDHTKPWAETGRTNTDDLAPACPYDHVTRHRCGWTYRRLANGDFLWTSRLGHRYTTSGKPP